nr:hypothetical protein [Tanacetum cinerariifolium]
MSCYNCNEKGHRKRDCPKLGRNGQGGDNHRGVYQLGAVNTQEDLKFVTGTFLLNNHYATALSDSGDRNQSCLKIISCIKARKYIENGYELFLAQVTGMVSKEKRVEDVLVIRDFPEVFPEDLPGLPPPRQFVNSNSSSTSSSGTLPSNTIANLRSDLKAINTRSGVSYDGPQIPPPPFFLPKVVENEQEATKDTVHPTNNGSTEYVQPSVVQTKTLVIQISNPVVELVISPVNALRPNQRPSIPYPSRLTPLNEHCSAVLLKKLPDKLGDAGKFLILCDFPEKAECLALADLGASINLMPLFGWNKLSLPDLSPTCLTLKLVDHSISHPVGVVEDVYVKVGTFHFPADFVVGDFNADPREVLRFSNMIASANPTPYYDPIVSTTSPTLTLFGNSDFLLEEVDAFLALEDDPTSPEVDQSYLDSEGDILLLEVFLNDDPSLPPPNQGNYLPKCDNPSNSGHDLFSKVLIIIVVLMLAYELTTLPEEIRDFNHKLLSLLKNR